MSNITIVSKVKNKVFNRIICLKSSNKWKTFQHNKCFKHSNADKEVGFHHRVNGHKSVRAHVMKCSRPNLSPKLEPITRTNQEKDPHVIQFATVLLR